MDTLGTTSKTTVKLAEAYSINKGFVATGVLRRGQVVKLNPNGEVIAIAAPTDRPLGVVVAGNRTAGDEVTVQTEFNAVIRASADGAVVTTNEVSCTGVSETGDLLSEFAVSAAGNVISGIALSDAADAEDVWVGILRVSSVKA